MNRTKNGHTHGEAFCLMTYSCVGKHVPAAPGSKNFMDRTEGCGHREIIWNSRDGVTPFGMGCPSCGGDLQHVSWSADVYTPNHKPNHGQGIWRDGTPDDAERIMRKRIESCIGTQYECNAARTEELVQIARNGGEGEFQTGWPMFTRHGLDPQPPSFKTEAELAEFLDSLHEQTPDGTVTNRKWEAAQRAKQAVLEG